RLPPAHQPRSVRAYRAGDRAAAAWPEPRPNRRAARPLDQDGRHICDEGLRPAAGALAPRTGSKTRPAQPAGPHEAPASPRAPRRRPELRPDRRGNGNDAGRRSPPRPKTPRRRRPNPPPAPPRRRLRLRLTRHFLTLSPCHLVTLSSPHPAPTPPVPDARRDRPPLRLR